MAEFDNQGIGDEIRFNFINVSFNTPDSVWKIHLKTVAFATPGITQAMNNILLQNPLNFVFFLFISKDKAKPITKAPETVPNTNLIVFITAFEN